MSYADLPEPAQLAIAYYMAIDGEAWELLIPPPRGWRQAKSREYAFGLKKALPEYVELYGHLRFGYVLIPMDELVTEIMRDSCIQEGMKELGHEKSFDEYHDWYVSQGHMPDHSSRDRWPVILAGRGDDEETLQDGWHRLHDYYRKGARVVPAIWFAS